MYTQKDEQENDTYQNTLFSEKQSKLKVLHGWSTFGGDFAQWRKYCHGQCIMGKQRSEGTVMETQRVAKPLGWRSGMVRDMDMCKIRNPRQSEGE